MRRIVLAALAVAVAACGGSRAERKETFTPVSNADFGRLAPDQMAPVDTARGNMASARDALARAELALQQSRQEEGYAKADQTAAEADAQRAAAEMRAAQQAGDSAMQARADEMAQAAELRKKAADARLAYANALVKAAEADVAATNARIATREAELERAKLTALTQAGIPAATKYEPGQFDRRVQQARAAHEEASAQAEQAQRAAITARQQWKGFQERYEARREGVGGRG